MGRNKAGEFCLNFMTESAQESKKNAKNKVNKVTSPDKKYPDFASTRFRIHYVIKNFHSQRIQNALDSYAAIHRIRVDGSCIRKEKVAYSKVPGYVWTRLADRRLYWAAIKLRLYRNIALHEKDKFTRTESKQLI